MANQVIHWNGPIRLIKQPFRNAYIYQNDICMSEAMFVRLTFWIMIKIPRIIDNKAAICHHKVIFIPTTPSRR